MTQAVHPDQERDLPRQRGRALKTTIQIAPHTKEYLDKIKEQANVDTYDQAILVMIRERKAHIASSFGKLSGIGSFRREEDDPHRIRH